jgi:hypothetical protein
MVKFQLPPELATGGGTISYYCSNHIWLREYPIAEARRGDV